MILCIKIFSDNLELHTSLMSNRMDEMFAGGEISISHLCLSIIFWHLVVSLYLAENRKINKSKFNVSHQIGTFKLNDFRWKPDI